MTSNSILFPLNILSSSQTNYTRIVPELIIYDKQEHSLPRPVSLEKSPVSITYKVSICAKQKESIGVCVRELCTELDSEGKNWETNSVLLQVGMKN